MENLLLSPDEHKLVLKEKKLLECKYNVNIYLPQCVAAFEHDVVVATVYGGKTDLIQNFIQRRLEEIKQSNELRTTVENDVTTITLSDSDSESSVPVLTERQQNNKRRRLKRRKKKHTASVNNKCEEPVNLTSTILIDDSEESSKEDTVQKRPKVESPQPSADFLPLTSQKENAANYSELHEKNSPVMKVKADSPISSTSFTPLDHENSDNHSNADDSIIVIDSQPAANNFFRSENENGNIPNQIDDSVIILDDEEIPRPVVKESRRLRPIVIDGSNVAREHGKVSNTFSCNGIKIAIDYFLKRGHEQVTAFVPNYRRHNKFGPIVTTDQHLLEELAKEQRVVFTPSRRINNKRVTCYDDRFIVELATTNGGVILSNDNYRDLLAENEGFKKTIEERLLMFCFVGDIIMIPQDPLGRNGPSLENFLSFPS